MGFLVGYTEAFMPKILMLTLSVLGFVKSIIFTLFCYLGISDILESYSGLPEVPSRRFGWRPSLSTVLIREILPVIKFAELDDVGCSDRPDICTVCLFEFETKSEIRWLRNCRHIFHRVCLDRWIDHDRNTCPLCRALFVPEEMQDDFDQRFWPSSDVMDFNSESSIIPDI